MYECEFRGVSIYEVDLQDFELRGEGGQAKVYGSKSTNYAIKLYHDVNSEEMNRLRLWLEHGEWNGLEHCAAVPSGLVKHDWRPIGYSMEKLDDFSLLTNLYQRDFCGNNKVSLKTIARLFVQLHEHLEFLHNKGFRVGDLNGSNVMVKLTAGKCEAVRLIDVDNWGLFRPFDVHFKPRYFDSTALHAKLPLENLDGKAYFDRLLEVDWCAFAMALTHAIFKHHPFEIGTVRGANLGPTKRQQENLTAWNERVQLNPFEQSLKLRLGAAFGKVLDDWITTRKKAKFPKQALLDFAIGLVACQTPDCKYLMTHYSVSKCPKCKAILPAPKLPASPRPAQRPQLSPHQAVQPQKTTSQWPVKPYNPKRPATPPRLARLKMSLLEDIARATTVEEDPFFPRVKTRKKPEN